MAQDRLLPSLLCHEVLNELDDFLQLQIQSEVPAVQDVYLGWGGLFFLYASPPATVNEVSCNAPKEQGTAVCCREATAAISGTT